MAEEFIFDVPSSDGSTNYLVSVVDSNNEELVVKCNCKAGLLGRLCKHKIAVISANMSQADAGVRSNWVRTEVGKALRRSALGTAFLRYVDAESKMEHAKKMFDYEKRSIESAMRGART
jgi:uncharacterized Zn finger protein